MGNNQTKAAVTAQHLRGDNSAEDEKARVELDELLEENRQFMPVTWGIANHCSMALQSLHALGARAADLREWNAKHFEGNRLPLGPSRTKIDVANWRSYLGRKEFTRDYVDFFTAEIKRLGSRKAALEAYMPTLLPALVKGLLHPLIRLSFALRHPDDGHVADALAYFAIRYELLFENTDADDANIAATQAPARAAAPMEILDDVRKAFRDHVYSGWGGNFGKVFHYCRLPEFRSVATERLHLTDANLADVVRDIARVAVHLYGAEPSLFTLHAVTGVQALIDALPYVSNKVECVRIYWIWLCALFKHKNCPRLPYTLAKSQRQFVDNSGTLDELARIGVRLNHVHLVKMLFALQLLRDLDEKKQAPLYVGLAHRMIERRAPW